MEATKDPRIWIINGVYYYRGTIDGKRADKLSLKTKSYREALTKARILESLHDLKGLKQTIEMLISLGEQPSVGIEDLVKTKV